MAKKKSKGPSQSQISEVMRELGRRGGEAKVPKGLASVSPERRAEIRAKGLKTRLTKKKAAAKKK